MNSEDEEEQGSQPAAGAQAQAAPRPSASSAADSRRRSDERGPLSSGSDSLPVPGSPLAAVGEEGEPPVTPLAAGPFSAGQDRLYCRLVLGRQRHTSFIKRSRPDGTAHWQQVGLLACFCLRVPWPAAVGAPQHVAHSTGAACARAKAPPGVIIWCSVPVQTFVFAVPLPLRDRQLRLELYRTPSSSHKGRLVSFAQVGGIAYQHRSPHHSHDTTTEVGLLMGWTAVWQGCLAGASACAPMVECSPPICTLLPGAASSAQVWLHDLLPAGLEDDPEASRTSSAGLEGMAKQQPAGRMHLRSTLIDTDLRRAAYQAPFAQESPPTADSSAIKAVPGKGPAAAGAEPPPRLQRLESATEQWSERELRKKTRKTGELRRLEQGAVAVPCLCGWAPAVILCCAACAPCQCMLPFGRGSSACRGGV